MEGFLAKASRRAAVVCVVAAVGSGSTACAQYYGLQSGHFDYHPGQYVPHNDHFHYQPGHFDYHDTSQRPLYVQPRTSYRHPQSNYVTPRTAYYQGEGHSHDHAGTHTARRIEYGGFSHIDDLAIALENQANDLCLELHYNYQHNPGWKQTYREAYEILTTAKYIHGLEHAGNRDKLRQAVGELDGLFHHVENDVANWTGHHHRQVGFGGLTDKIEAVEETLHHLMDDMGVRPQTTGEPAPPSDPGFEAAAPPAADDTPLVVPN